MRFMKVVALLAGIFTFGMFFSCSNLDESDSGTISIALPGESGRAASSDKESFLNDLNYYAYLVKDASLKYDTSDSTVDTFFSGVAEYFKSLGSIQKQTGSAGETMKFSEIESGSYTIYLFYLSTKYEEYGYAKETIEVKDGESTSVTFKLSYPDSISSDDFDGYTAISSYEELQKALSSLSTDGVTYPDEDTYTKFYLTSDIVISEALSIETPSSDSYGILIDLNEKTITSELSESTCSLGDNINIVFKNGSINTTGNFVTTNSPSGSNAAATVKFDGITASTSTSEDSFVGMTDGTVVVTGSSSINTAKVAGGLLVLLGGTIDTVTQSSGSLALVESYTAEGTEFTADNANTVSTLTLENSETWKMLYIGGNSTITDAVSLDYASIVSFKIMQTSTCTSSTGTFMEMSFGYNAVANVLSSAYMLFTKYSGVSSCFEIMSEPETSCFTLPSGYSFSSSTTETTSNDGGTSYTAYTIEQES